MNRYNQVALDVQSCCDDKRALIRLYIHLVYVHLKGGKITLNAQLAPGCFS